MNESYFQTSFGTSRESLVKKLRALADDLENLDADVQPKGPIVTLRKWAIGERGVPCLIGHADHHPILGGNRPVWSSELFYLDRDRGIARTISRWYRLEDKADPNYWDGAVFER